MDENDEELRPPRHVDLGQGARHDHVDGDANVYHSFQPPARIEVVTQGGPLLFLLQPSPLGAQQYGGVRITRHRGDQKFLGAMVRLTRDGEPVSGVTSIYDQDATKTASDSVKLPLSMISFVDLAPPSGKHVYELVAKAYPGCILILDFTRIVALELGR